MQLIACTAAEFPTLGCPMPYEAVRAGDGVGPVPCRSPHVPWGRCHVPRATPRVTAARGGAGRLCLHLQPALTLDTHRTDHKVCWAGPPQVHQPADAGHVRVLVGWGGCVWVRAGCVDKPGREVCRRQRGCAGW